MASTNTNDPYYTGYSDSESDEDVSVDDRIDEAGASLMQARQELGTPIRNDPLTFRKHQGIILGRMAEQADVTNKTNDQEMVFLKEQRVIDRGIQDSRFMIFGMSTVTGTPTTRSAVCDQVYRVFGQDLSKKYSVIRQDVRGASPLLMSPAQMLMSPAEFTDHFTAFGNAPHIDFNLDARDVGEGLYQGMENWIPSFVRENDMLPEIHKRAKNNPRYPDLSKDHSISLDMADQGLYDSLRLAPHGLATWFQMLDGDVLLIFTNDIDDPAKFEPLLSTIDPPADLHNIDRIGVYSAVQNAAMQAHLRCMLVKKGDFVYLDSKTLFAIYRAEKTLSISGRILPYDAIPTWIDAVSETLKMRKLTDSDPEDVLMYVDFALEMVTESIMDGDSSFDDAIPKAHELLVRSAEWLGADLDNPQFRFVATGRLDQWKDDVARLMNKHNEVFARFDLEERIESA